MPTSLHQRRGPPARRAAPLVALFLSLAPLPAQEPDDAAGEGAPRDLYSRDLDGLEWRGIGPLNTGGRITDLAVVAGDPSVFYVAAATGGVWRTTNAGTTFEPVFEHQGSASVGAVAVAPSEPDVVWVGTGEANARNSVSWGDGVYRSTDGGETFEHVGLRGTRHVGRIVVHPRNPDVVFVAALGRLWGPSAERGLYRTRDGGRSWTLCLHMDEDTGCVDAAIDPEDPDTVYAVAYAVRRDAFDGSDPARKFGEGSGIYKSTDGGDTWRRLEKGLPTGRLGRIGIDVWRKDPRVLYAVIETERTGQPTPGGGGNAVMGIRGQRGGEARISAITPGGGAEKAGLKAGDVVLELDGEEVADYDGLVAAIRSHGSGDTVAVRYRRDGAEGTVELTFGGRGFSAYMGGQRENVQDRQGPEGFETGGVFRSDDGGESWRRMNSLAARPFYFGQVRVDPLDDLRVWVLGVQLFRSKDGGRRFRNDGARGVHVDHHALWIDPADPRHMLLGNDGGVHVTWDRGRHWEVLGGMDVGQLYAVAVDDRRPYRVYGGLQDNGTWGIPSRTRDAAGILWDHAFKVGGGDGFLCAVEQRDDDAVYYESQFGRIARVDVSTGRRSRVEAPRRGVRWNWRTPFFLSPHNEGILYFAGNKVFRSIDRGRTSQAVSGDLARTGRGSVTALAESPREPGTLWAGTDDGALWITRDGGATWTPLEERVPGLERRLWVSHVECSRAEAGRAYVVLDGHRSDDLTPYVFRTDDHGAAFRAVVEGLPETVVRVVREDPVSPDLLYAGTEIGVYVSFDGGGHWGRFRGGLPTVPVHDLVVHRRERELVAATHGRGIWIVDAAPLQDMDVDVADAPVHLFPPKTAVDWLRLRGRGRYGRRRHRMPNPPRGATISYWLREEVEGGARIEVFGLEGKRLEALEGPGEAGIHQVHWDLGTGPRRRRRHVGPGTYRVRLEAAGTVQEAKLVVVPDPLDRARTTEEASGS